MRLKSHLHIANITFEIIEQISEVQLDKRYVRLGSIMPDLMPNRRRQLHSPNKVHEHYGKEMRRILNKDKGIKRISYIIGLLTHYITDAFCLSHNIYVTNLRKHIQYEYLLDDFKLDYKIPEDILNTITNSIKTFQNEQIDVQKYIDISLEAYLKVIQKDDWMLNIQQDMEHAIIQVSTIVFQFIDELKQNNIAAVTA